MRHVLFSFLGTGKYKNCIYSWNEQALTETRYVQTAIYEYLQTIEHPLTVIVFTTDDAYEKNWLDGEEEGLASTFQRLAPEATLQMVRIDNPEGEAENWKLFDAILNEIQEGDHIYFDMTHSFRAIPIVSLIVMNYARFIKKATLEKLVYGQFNGDTGTILDMTNMLELLSWTNGVDQFIRTGDATQIGELVQTIAKDSFKNKEMSSESRSSLLDLKKVAEQLENVSLAIQTCRSTEIVKEIELLQKHIATAKEKKSNFIQPLVPLLDEIESKYAHFSEGAGYEAARWSAEHGLIQIGYTLLQENFVTALSEYLQFNPTNKEQRTLINSAIKIVADQLPKEQWHGDEQRKEQLANIVEQLPFNREQLLKYSKLTDYRNDINHAGMRPNATKAANLKRELHSAVEQMEELFQLLQTQKIGG
ncbi:TIGR02221 family CRISPR-associated protein [Caryophanon latum]|uniref:CRISPR-associated protein n=1 Tax=Caryophanon latum TaxID=33977 RepID=A0A1C0YVC3_9BACL|nr:TIGR02221 family CRISPR-associated protein [Caryophanon latum]OCS91125.1 CRISPR-associated protein [Caryophanon latum]